VPLALYAMTVDAVPRVEPVAFGLPGAVIAGAVGCLAAGLGVVWIVTRGTNSAATG
jgi:hypothetical protein